MNSPKLWWPTPITRSGDTPGLEVLLGASSEFAGFYWSPHWTGPMYVKVHGSWRIGELSPAALKKLPALNCATCLVQGSRHAVGAQ